MNHRSVFAYPWDVIDGDGSVAEFLNWVSHSDLNAVTVATSYHAGKFIRPAAKSGPRVIFPEDGTVYFRPDLSRYGKIAPRVSQFTRQSDVLQNLCDSQQHNIIGWTVLLHNTRLGQEHRQASVKNAFGDPYPYSLCPSHPDCQEYAINLCADISRSYAVGGLSIETPGFLPFAHGFHHEFAQIPSNPWLDHHLGLCFCDHCMTSAREEGIDANGLKQQVASAVDAYLQSPEIMTTEQAVQRLGYDRTNISELGAYIDHRCKTVTTLVADIKSAMRSDCELFVIPTTARPTSDCWIEGSDLSELARVADGVEVPFYDATVDAIIKDVAESRKAAGNAARMRGILRPGQPDLEVSEDLLKATKALHQFDVEGVSYYNYGLLRPHHHDAIGLAARAARSETQGT